MGRQVFLAGGEGDLGRRLFAPGSFALDPMVNPGRSYLREPLPFRLVRHSALAVYHRSSYHPRLRTITPL